MVNEEGQDAEDLLRELVLALDRDIRKPGSDGRVSAETMGLVTKAARFLSLP